MSAELEGLDLVSLLDLLEPVPEPPPISMMPQTVGWIWLGIVFAGGCFVAGRWLLRRWRANAYRRAALAALEVAGNDPALIEPILKRAALGGFPRAEVAGLWGADWLAFLQTTCPNLRLSAPAEAALSGRAYARAPAPVEGLNALARTWVRQHKAQAQ